MPQIHQRRGWRGACPCLSCVARAAVVYCQAECDRASAGPSAVADLRDFPSSDGAREVTS